MVKLDRCSSTVSRTSPALSRWPLLLAGLTVFGIGIALAAEAELRLGPWSVLHDGVSRQIGGTLRTADIGLSLLRLPLWWPSGERSGVGTVLAGLAIGTMTKVGWR